MQQRSEPYAPLIAWRYMAPRISISPMIRLTNALLPRLEKRLFKNGSLRLCPTPDDWETKKSKEQNPRVTSVRVYNPGRGHGIQSFFIPKASSACPAWGSAYGLRSDMPALKYPPQSGHCLPHGLSYDEILRWHVSARKSRS